MTTTTTITTTMGTLRFLLYAVHKQFAAPPRPSRMYAACAYKRGAKSYNNKRTAYAQSSFYRDETRANAISCYTSLAKWQGHGSARPTIIFF